jgi:hypothetical protein
MMTSAQLASLKTASCFETRAMEALDADRVSRTNCDYPTGKSVPLPLRPLSSPLRKNIPLRDLRKSAIYRPRPVPNEGRFAIVTNVGDGMRWTRAVLETKARHADGEGVWS